MSDKLGVYTLVECFVNGINTPQVALIIYNMIVTNKTNISATLFFPVNVGNMGTTYRTVRCELSCSSGYQQVEAKLYAAVDFLRSDKHARSITM